jgi:uncharacterized membrane protein
MTILMAGVIGVALFICGNVVDYLSLSNQKNELQGVADRASVAAAQELIVAKASEARIDRWRQALLTPTIRESRTKPTRKSSTRKSG